MGPFGPRIIFWPDRARRRPFECGWRWRGWCPPPLEAPGQRARQSRVRAEHRAPRRGRRRVAAQLYRSTGRGRANGGAPARDRVTVALRPRPSRPGRTGHVLGVTRDQIQSMPQKRQHHVQPLLDALGAAGKVHNQRIPKHAGYPSGEDRHRGLGPAVRPDRLRQTGGLRFDDRQRRLGCHVPGAEPGAAGRYHQVAGFRHLDQCRLDLRTFVGDDPPFGYLESRLGQCLGKNPSRNRRFGCRGRRRR